MKIEQVDIVYRCDTDEQPTISTLSKERTYFFYFDDEIGKWWCKVGYPDKHQIETERTEK